MKNFGDIAPNYARAQDAKIVVLPVPYDKTSTWGKGADKGPQALIEASCNMELFDIQTQSEVFRQGIHTAAPLVCETTPEKMSQVVEKNVAQWLKNNKLVVTIGGEHSVSIGAIFAHATHFENLTVLQLDAHADMRQSYNGSTFNHACVMARAQECCPVVQVGIRSMDSAERKTIKRPQAIFYAHQIRKSPEWQAQVLNLLTDNVYLTIDLDVFDPAIMPSTGTPEPGGMLWYQVLDFLELVNQKTNIVGFDVVELAPNPANKAPDFLAAKLIYRLVSEKFNQKH